MVQIVRPIGDNGAGDWTGNPGPALYSALDEVSASDADTILDSIAIGNPTSIVLGNPTDPVSATGHIVRWRSSITGWVDDAITLTIELKQATTLIATARSGAITNGTPASASYTLSAGEANSITNYSLLNLVFTAAGQVDDGATVVVAWAEFETPDAPVGRKTNPLAGPTRGLIS